ATARDGSPRQTARRASGPAIGTAPASEPHSRGAARAGVVDPRWVDVAESYPPGQVTWLPVARRPVAPPVAPRPTDSVSGLAATLARAGARVVWRCHIGVDWEDEVTRAGWEFLRPHLAAAEVCVFSRQTYVPSWIPAGKAWIIPPSIDPFSPKNQHLAADT